MSKNTNRDYLIIVDVKASTIKEYNKLEFYINDKESHNIFVQLVVKEAHDIINKYVVVDDPNLYELTLNIVKPTNEPKKIIGELISLEDGLYEFKLPQDCCDKVGTYKCELQTKYNSRITNSNRIKYRIKKSVLNDLDGVVDAPGYPIVIQLLDKLSDIEQYEEDRRANELARQLAEEQRQTRFDTLDADMIDRITAMDDKMVDVENRVSSKEQAVDTLIVDTKADIDEYKVAKDQEIDEYKTAKDTEINNAITNQDNKIDTAISDQNDRIALVENNVVSQNDRLDIIENKNQQQDNRLDVVEAKNTEQDNRLTTIEAIDVAQNTRLDAIEVKNQQQDDRLLDIEKVNKRQDMNLKCLFAESKNNMIDIAEEGNSIFLQNSTIGYTLIDEIKGNTLVNCNKEPDKELILNGNINTSGDNTVTITEGVDGGLVDVVLEGNTLVNVSKTKDSTSVTKAYTVENSGNHIALQDDVDGNCRPVIEGNTLVNLFDKSINWEGSVYKSLTFARITNGTFTFKAEIGDKSSNPGDAVLQIKAKNKNDNTLRNLYATYNNSHGNLNLVFTLTEDEYLYINNYGITDDNFYKNYPKPIILEGDYTDKPIPDYFEGLQSTFEDNLVTQEMIDSGEEVADNLGKYKVDYKVTREDGTVGSTKTLYLNSPLLEGDTIEEKEDGIYHAHRYKSRVLNGSEDWENSDAGINETLNAFDFRRTGGFPSVNTVICDKMERKKAWDAQEEGIWLDENCIITISKSKSNDIEAFKTYLSNNPMSVVYKLAEPTYELIEQSDLVLPSYANGHLDFNTAVPVEKVEFKPFSEELTYLYPSTSYTVQFTSDKAITADINLGGTQLLAQSIVTGLNRISITTPATLVDNKLVINGVGANIMKVVVTDTDREFMYFEGMKSVGECEGNIIEVLSTTNNLLDLSLIDGLVVEDDKIVAKKIASDCVSSLKLKPNTRYKITTEKYGNNPSWIGFGYTANGVYTYIGNSDNMTNKVIEFTTPNENDIVFHAGANVYGDIGRYLKLIKLEYANSSNDSTIAKHNKQQLTHEPLRAVGEVKDRYVLLDGKWYIERNVGKYIYTGNEHWSPVDDDRTTDTARTFLAMNTPLNAKLDGNLTTFKSDKLPNKMHTTSDLGIWIDIHTFITLPRNEVNTVAELKLWLQSNPITGLYQLKTPQYEPIYYDPLKIYSEVAHITTNSTIPTNIIVKNHGYNCLLKPSTTYTVASNLGINTVTTPSVLTEDCLRFYDTDTSDVTAMKDVLVLEGDWTTKSDLIPANFSGIESAFEQELITDENDANYGKYKVNAKVVGKNLFDGQWHYGWLSNGTVVTSEKWKCSDYIQVPANTKIKLSPYYSLAEYDYNKKHIKTYGGKNPTTTSLNCHYIRICVQTSVDTSKFQIELGDTATAYEPYKENNITFYINEPLRGVGDTKDRVYVKDDKVVVQRNCGSKVFDGSDDEGWIFRSNSNGCSRFYRVDNTLLPKSKMLCDTFSTYPALPAAWTGEAISGHSNSHELRLYLNEHSLTTQDKVGLKQWLSENPTTVVYQLAEPTYEEVEYNDVKLFIESFKNSTLFYNSNVPVSSKLWYSYSVPIVDTVAQTASISDEQDVMIIDLATQVAVMEMLLM